MKITFFSLRLAAICLLVFCGQNLAAQAPTGTYYTQGANRNNSFNWAGPTASVVSVDFDSDVNNSPSAANGEKYMEFDRLSAGDDGYNLKAKYNSVTSTKSFFMQRRAKWHKNGGWTGNGTSINNYIGKVTLTFSNPVPANEIFVRIFDMDHRGVDNQGVDGYVKFPGSQAKPADFERLEGASGLLLGYNNDGDITGFNALGAETAKSAYIALTGKNTNTVSSIIFFVRNVGDDVHFEIGWVDLPKDRGDAPNTYGTTKAGSGPSHTIVQELYLGSPVEDEDADGQSTEQASGDDTAGDDEDGIVANGLQNQDPPKIPNTVTSGSETIGSYGFDVAVTNKFSKAAKVIGWLDWNRNGTFESSEASDVVDVAGNSNNVTKTLSWSGRTLDHANFDGYTYLRLRLSSDPELTVNAPGGSVLDGEVEDYRVEMSKQIVMPVTLVGIEARESEPGNVLVQWKTSYESASSGFEIQRSVNAKSFEAVGFVASSNEGVAMNEYEFTDKLPALNAGNIYYRLKSIDLDGTFAYSTIVDVRLSKESIQSFAVWPIPAERGSELTLRGSSPVTSLRLYDLQGREVATNLMQRYSGEKLQLGNVGNGTYLLRINNTQTIKVLIK